MTRFKDKPFRQSLTKNALLILGILLVGYIIVTFSLRGITRHGQEFVLPDFSGMTLQKAQSLAGEADLRLIVSDSVYIRGMERGLIARQNPIPGSKVKKNRRVLLVINSIIPKQVEVPSLIGFSLRQARTEIAGSGLTLGRLIYEEDLATDNVLRQLYRGRDIAPGRKIDSDSRIDLVLGLNPNDTATFVPTVIGYRYQMAKDIIHDNSLNIAKAEFDGTVLNYTDSLEAMVYGQFPEASDSLSVRVGTEVTLYLSKDASRIPEPEPEIPENGKKAE